MFEDEFGVMHPSRELYERAQTMRRLIDEGWAFVDGYSRYVVSPHGEVMNYKFQRLITQRINPGTGRAVVSLVHDDGAQTTVSVGRLVAEAYIPLPDQEDGGEAYYDVGYLDDNPANNDVNNLTWVPRWSRYRNR